MNEYPKVKPEHKHLFPKVPLLAYVKGRIITRWRMFWRWLTGWETVGCGDCWGQGHVYTGKIEKCWRCRGHGEYKVKAM